jgi:hypothetical protein
MTKYETGTTYLRANRGNSDYPERNMKLHALLGHPVSENFVSWCQTLKNSSASFLCIQQTYIISTISQFESDSKNPNHDSRKLKFSIFENFTNHGESIRDINRGSRE